MEHIEWIMLGTILVYMALIVGVGVFFSRRAGKGADAFYYEENPLPVALIEGDAPVRLNAEQTNFLLWAVCWREDFVHLDFYHGLSDGTGIYRVLSALLRTYYALKGELTDEPVQEEIPPEWTADPQDTLPPPAPAAPATDCAAAPITLREPLRRKAPMLSKQSSSSLRDATRGSTSCTGAPSAVPVSKADALRDRTGMPPGVSSGCASGFQSEKPGSPRQFLTLRTRTSPSRRRAATACVSALDLPRRST